jgi:hypothetical protein
MSFRKKRQDLLRSLGQVFLPVIATTLCKSLRLKKVNDEQVNKLNELKQNYILAFWHGTMLLPWYLHGSTRFVALTSKSKDGNLLSKTLKHWNYKVVRGSSSSGGNVALGIMVDYAKNNYSIAITPDGPRGPAHKFKAGAVVAAKKSKIPLVLAGVGYEKKRVLKNWDQFEVPSYFSKSLIIYSNPINIPSVLNYNEVSEMINKCELQLNELQKQAEEMVSGRK